MQQTSKERPKDSSNTRGNCSFSHTCAVAYLWHQGEDVSGSVPTQGVGNGSVERPKADRTAVGIEEWAEDWNERRSVHHHIQQGTALGWIRGDVLLKQDGKKENMRLSSAKEHPVLCNSEAEQYANKMAQIQEHGLATKTRHAIIHPPVREYQHKMRRIDVREDKASLCHQRAWPCWRTMELQMELKRFTRKKETEFKLVFSLEAHTWKGIWEQDLYFSQLS